MNSGTYATAARSAVTVRELSVVFGGLKSRGGAVNAVDSVSFDVAEGEIVCLVGPSGCGKSTALNVIAGMQQSKPAEGTSVSGTIQIHVAPSEPMHRRLGYMFQRDTLLPWLTTSSNVALPMKIRGDRDYAARVTELLELTGLSGFGDRYPKELSGGMRKRVQLAQLLAQDPAVLLMDEPFGALDAQTRALMQQEFLDVWERDRKTIIFVTHDLTEAVLLGDRILCMTSRPGRIKSEYVVDLERPRRYETLIADPRYGALVSRLWDDLRDEAGRALSTVD